MGDVGHEHAPRTCRGPTAIGRNNAPRTAPQRPLVISKHRATDAMTSHEQRKEHHQNHGMARLYPYWQRTSATHKHTNTQAQTRMSMNTHMHERECGVDHLACVRKAHTQTHHRVPQRSAAMNADRRAAVILARASEWVATTRHRTPRSLATNRRES